MPKESIDYQSTPLDDQHYRRRATRAALGVAVVYLVLGCAWIAISDHVLAVLVSATGDPLHMFTWIQTIKGWLFVFVTAAFLFITMRAYVRTLHHAQGEYRAKLNQVARAYQLLFDSNPLPMWVLDPDSLDILAVNDVTVQTYGYTREEFLRMKITALRLPEEIPKLLEELKTIPLSRPGYRRGPPRRHRRKDGSVLDVELIGSDTVFNGRVARLIVAMDVTERLKAQAALAEHQAELEKRVEERTQELSLANAELQKRIEERHKIGEQLRAAKVAAEAASEAKSVFLANTSHEIRTPLTSILGYADLLMENSLPLDQRERYVGIVQRNATHLLTLIDDLLDLSRVEMGKMSVTAGDYSPREIAQQAVDLLRPRAAETNLPLTLEFSPDVPAMIKTDGVRVRQVLLNLLSNAIKFTAEGRVSVMVRLEKEATREMIRFEVSDTGIGMPAEQLHQIFERFFQIEQGANRRYGGSGLGLTISRQLVEQMGGTIEVASTLGKGSTFTVRIPAVMPAGLSRPAFSGPAVAVSERIEGHILLAEDNVSIRWLVEEYLRRAGGVVTAVANGQEAVDQITGSLGRTDATAIDLVLIDINMPNMDGPEAMRQMRKAGYRGPIVALTAHSPADQQRRWTDLGCDAVAGKPIDRKTFIPLLARLIQEGRGAREAGVGI